ncbi:MAG: DMT family transporter [Anaerolineae bacterium]|nr:MAG: DMT family transporter [Anaerolineae bacterium]
MEAATPTAAARTDCPWQAYMAMIFGVVCISTSGIFIKLASVPGPVAGAYRVGIAATLMLVPFLLHARRVRWTRRMLLLAGVGGIFFACDIALWNTALLSTSVANAVLLGNTAPIWVGLGAIVLFHQRLKRQFWWGVALAIAGASLIVGPGPGQDGGGTVGSLLALASSLFYASYLLVTQRARVRLDALSYFWLAAVASLLTLLGMTAVLDQPLAVPHSALLPLLGLGIVTHTLGWLSLNYAQGHLPASLVAPSLLGQPIIASLLAIPILGKRLAWFQVIGGAIVMAGIFLVHRA